MLAYNDEYIKMREAVSEFNDDYRKWRETRIAQWQKKQEERQNKIDSAIETLEKIDGELSLERLREILISLGINGASAHSRAVTLAYGILTKCDEEQIRDAARLGDEIAHMNQEIENLDCNMEKTYKDERKNIHDERERLQDERAELDAKAKEIAGEQEKLSQLIERIDNAADQDTKSKIIMAQWFKDNVTVNTAYDNTAYIIGLASVLGSPAAIEQLQEINPKLFENTNIADKKTKRRI